MAGTDDRMEILDRETCLELLRTVPIGRVAWVADDGQVVVLPVNFIVDGDGIVFRTAEGGKLEAARHGQPVSFQADDVEPALHLGWSVLASGQAHVVEDPNEVARLESLPLAPWEPSPKPFFVRIDTQQISGRRLRLHPGEVTVEEID